MGTIGRSEARPALSCPNVAFMSSVNNSSVGDEAYNRAKLSGKFGFNLKVLDVAFLWRRALRFEAPIHIGLGIAEQIGHGSPARSDDLSACGLT